MLGDGDVAPAAFGQKVRQPGGGGIVVIAAEAVMAFRFAGLEACVEEASGLQRAADANRTKLPNVILRN